MSKYQVSLIDVFLCYSRSTQHNYRTVGAERGCVSSIRLPISNVLILWW